VTYTPRAWEPPTLSGAESDTNQITRYQFTRSGLRGVDFGGSEVRARNPG
jgi:hypothetical protein